MDITPDNIGNLTDRELNDAYDIIRQEQIRRDEVIGLPTLIDTMTQKFVDSGGDKGKLKNPNSYAKGPKQK